MVTSVTNQKRVAFIGRFMPLHNGHKAVLLKLVREYDKLIIIIGSCYTNGDERNCISSTERVKMVLAILKMAEIPNEKFEIVEIADYATFDEWWQLVVEKCHAERVTHICTGNQEDILSVLAQRKEELEFEMINPETDSDFPHHATDIRKMIIEGRYEELTKLVPIETLPILFQHTFKEIIAASKNQGISFIPGRQTVDIIFLIRNTIDGKIYTLLGKRSMEKQDFPGYLGLPGGGIDTYEIPINASVREFYEETGLELEILDNSLEPAIVRVKNVPDAKLEQMHYLGIYSSEDETVAGTRGGSSQCFGVFVEDELDKYEEYLNPTSDLTEVKFYEIYDAISKGLAYQHGAMLERALRMFNASPLLRKMGGEGAKPKKKNTLIISIIGAPGAGKSTAALGIAYQLKKMGKSVEYVQEFAKDLVYNALLGKYIPNQSYIIAQQYKRVYDLIGQVDYIVTDAGLEICALHASNESKVVEDLAWYLKGKNPQISIFIERDEEKVPYETEGRGESEAESRLFGIRLEEYMKANGAEYTKVIGSDLAERTAIAAVEKYERNVKALEG